MRRLGLDAAVRSWRARSARAAPGKAAGLDSGLTAWLTEVLIGLDRARLRAELEALPGPRSRIHHPESMRAAEELVTAALARSGWEVRRQEVAVDAGIGVADHGNHRRTRYRGLRGANVLALKAGETPSALVVLAHLDTVRDSPGANDNGAAVVALLNVARLLAPLPLTRTVVLAATDFEEIGLFGARALVSSLRHERRVVAAINLETIAYVDRRPGTQRLPPGIGALYPRQLAALRRRGLPADFVTLIHDGAAAGVAATYAAALAVAGGPDVAVTLRAPAELARAGPLLIHALPVVNNFARGDHAAFWAAGIPALQVTDTADFRYRAYHRPGDTADRIDYERLAELIAATAVAVRALAGDARSPGAV